jgi:hypothetical protein
MLFILSEFDFCLFTVLAFGRRGYLPMRWSYVYWLQKSPGWHGVLQSL